MKRFALTALVMFSGCLDLSTASYVRDAGSDAGRNLVPEVLNCSARCTAPESTCKSASTRTSFRLTACNQKVCEFQAIDSACANGCVEGRCAGEPCVGVFCERAPAATCVGTSTLRAWVAPGVCGGDGGCTYSSIDLPCANGCRAGACIQEPCAGVQCLTPPPALCLGNTLRTFETNGTCDAVNGCRYTAREVECAAGCSEGACNSTACLNVSCEAPPATTCASSTSRTVFSSPGLCTNGSCSYTSSPQTCPEGTRCVGGVCSVPPPTCSAANCAGCCAGDVCLLMGSQSHEQCGAAGTACVACGPTQLCSEGGACVCAPQCSGKTCGPDGCGGSCGDCSGATSCSGGTCVCTPESDTALCARLAKNCGMVNATDNCNQARTVNCGSCSGTESCGSSNVCTCTSESNAAFCSRLGKNCGAVSGTDNCGQSRSITCGTCVSPAVCGTSGVCGCSAETDATFCARLGKTCGTVTGTDNCGASRSIDCGQCTAPQSCTANNVCACTSESNTAFCARLNKTCGTVSGSDNCGVSRSVSCGTCSSPLSCSTGTCVCSPESNTAFCSRLGKNCDSVSANDNCGTARTVSCGSCTSPQTCGGGGTANVCGRQRLLFTTSWQTLPNTGSALLEFKCNGTVSLGGTRCSAAQDPVQLRINGTEVTLYPGCTGSRSTNCMTDITPSTATYKEYSDNGGSLLLCDAMGYSIFNSVADALPGTLSRNIGVVQTNPTVYGTAVGLKNYGTYLECVP